MDAVSTTPAYLLADARAALRRRVDNAARTELSAAFAAWLLPSTETDAEFVTLIGDAATREGARQDFQTVAALGFGAHAGILCAKQIEALKKGLLRLAGREVVIDELPVAFCSDAVGVLGVALGAKAVADTEVTDQVLKWTAKFLTSSYDAERTEDWNRCLFAATDRQFGSPLNLSFPKTPATADVRTALVAKGVIEVGDDGPAENDSQQTLRLTMCELPDELPSDRAALRLAAVVSVIQQAAMSPIRGTSAAQTAKRSNSLSGRDLQIHDVVGGERFRTLPNAEIMKDSKLRKRLLAECKLDAGDAAKNSFDRIRRAKGYPSSTVVKSNRAAHH